MTDFYLGIAAFLLLTVAFGLYRVVLGPQPASRMIAAQLATTTGLAVVLLLGAALDESAALDIAVVFALLAALAAAAFVRCGYALAGDGRDRDDAGEAGGER